MKGNKKRWGWNENIHVSNIHSYLGLLCFGVYTPIKGEIYKYRLNRREGKATYMGNFCGQQFEESGFERTVMLRTVKNPFKSNSKRKWYYLNPKSVCFYAFFQQKVNYERRRRLSNRDGKMLWAAVWKGSFAKN